VQKKKTKNRTDNFFIISLEKKRKLSGIFLIISALLMLLSILSYSRFDQASLNYNLTDFFKVFSTDPDFLHRAQYTHNWLGIFGAYLSNFLINSTLGYFSIVIPLVLFPASS
jgi:S-DNA-T family DNA segregation ATPase FtsK/SpoIIIE